MIKSTGIDFFYFLRHQRCFKMQPPARCSNHRCVYIDQCDVIQQIIYEDEEQDWT